MPFAALQKPPAEQRLVLISIAAPVKDSAGDQGLGAAYNADAKFFDVFTASIDPPPDLRISHSGCDRKHACADDPNTWLPITALQHARDKGVFGELAEQLIGLPTNRSQRVTLEKDASAVLDACRQLSQDATLHGALTLLTQADQPRSTLISEQLWQEDDAWEQDYWDISRLDTSAIDKLKQEHERVRATSAEIQKKP